MILGLTGGMGCGKSTAARIFEELGWRRLDSDEIVRHQLLRQPEVVQAVTARWGKGVAEGGVIDRVAVAERVFTDDKERLWLEEMLHPRLFDHWRERLAEEAGASWVLEVPLLFEKGLENWFDFTVCVAASSANQLARLQERGLSQTLAGLRISKQLPLAQKCELADFVLSNDGSVDFLRSQVMHLHRRLTDLDRR